MLLYTIHYIWKWTCVAYDASCIKLKVVYFAASCVSVALFTCRTRISWSKSSPFIRVAPTSETQKSATPATWPLFSLCLLWSSFPESTTSACFSERVFAPHFAHATTSSPRTPQEYKIASSSERKWWGKRRHPRKDNVRCRRNIAGISRRRHCRIFVQRCPLKNLGKRGLKKEKLCLKTLEVTVFLLPATNDEGKQRMRLILARSLNHLNPSILGRKNLNCRRVLCQ